MLAIKCFKIYINAQSSSLLSLLKEPLFVFFSSFESLPSSSLDIMNSPIGISYKLSASQ